MDAIEEKTTHADGRRAEALTIWVLRALIAVEIGTLVVIRYAFFPIWIRWIHDLGA